MRMSKRLVFLEKMIAEGSTDPFALYGLAMEYRTLERCEEALSTFQLLRQRQPSYVAMYLMCGQMLDQMGRKEEAREWISVGIEQAQMQKNGHALSELQAALATIHG